MFNFNYKMSKGQKNIVFDTENGPFGSFSACVSEQILYFDSGDDLTSVITRKLI